MKRIFSNYTELKEIFDNINGNEYICHLYQSNEESLNAAIVLLEAGMKKGKRCIYISDYAKCNQLRAKVNNIFPPQALLKKTDQLIIKEISINVFCK